MKYFDRFITPAKIPNYIKPSGDELNEYQQSLQGRHREEPRQPQL